MVKKKTEKDTSEGVRDHKDQSLFSLIPSFQNQREVKNQIVSSFTDKSLSNERDSFNDFRDKLLNKYEEKKPEYNRAQAQLRTEKWRASIPVRFHNATLKNFRSSEPTKEKIIEALRGSNDSMGLYIKGPAGSGKTFLAYAIADALVKKGWVRPSRVLYITEDTIRRFTVEGFQGENKFTDIISKDYDLVIFDKVGNIAALSNKELTNIEEFINFLYMKVKRVVITSKYPPGEWVRDKSLTAASNVKSILVNGILNIGNQFDSKEPEGWHEDETLDSGRGATTGNEDIYDFSSFNR